MAERRHTERQKTTNGAPIFFGQEPGVFSCTLRDINDFGIGLRLNDPDVIEETFKITLDNFKSVQPDDVVLRPLHRGDLFDIFLGGL